MTGVDVDCIKVVPFGTIDTDQDWSTGWFFKVEGLSTPPTTAQINTALGALEDDLETWWNDVKIVCNSHCVFLGSRGYWYPSGSKVSTVVGEHLAAGAIPGTSAASTPTQTSVVASMKTGISGRSARGRSYLPANGLPLDVTNQISNGNVHTLSLAYSHVLADLSLDLASSLASSGVAPVVYSAKTGGTHQIISVTVDSRPDVQRRRADKIIANYAENNPVTPS